MNTSVKSDTKNPSNAKSGLAELRQKKKAFEVLIDKAEGHPSKCYVIANDGSRIPLHKLKKRLAEIEAEIQSIRTTSGLP